jgi:hypothetical protein
MRYAGWPDCAAAHSGVDDPIGSVLEGAPPVPIGKVPDVPAVPVAWAGEVGPALPEVPI